MIGYLIDSVNDLPDDVLKIMELSKELIQSKVGILLKYFKDYREEAKIITTIKFKA